MDRIRSIAIHEAAHAVVGEHLGARVKYATCVPTENRAGVVHSEVSTRNPLATATSHAAGHATSRFLDPDFDGAEGASVDFENVWKLDERFPGQDIGNLAIALAHDTVRKPRVAFTILAVADELVARAERGFGMSSQQLGEAISRAHDEFDRGQLLWGQKPKKAYSLKGCGPTEEMARRKARLREIGVQPTTPVKSAKTKPAPRRTVARTATRSSKGVLPQADLFRAVYALPVASGSTSRPAVRLVAAPGTGRTLDLQWYVANQWTEIDSHREGHFMERIAPGAAAKTITENRANMRILLEHGRDPQLGNKPIAAIDDLGENNIGGYARGELFAGLDPLVVDGLRAGQYGASFRFGVTRDELVKTPARSDYNPKGLPERTIREMNVAEMGPVVWGAYSAASAGVRSITDQMGKFKAIRA